jgi:hypothetical protein
MNRNIDELFDPPGHERSTLLYNAEEAKTKGHWIRAAKLFKQVAEKTHSRRRLMEINRDLCVCDVNAGRIAETKKEWDIAEEYYIEAEKIAIEDKKFLSKDTIKEINFAKNRCRRMQDYYCVQKLGL